MRDQDIPNFHFDTNLSSHALEFLERLKTNKYNLSQPELYERIQFVNSDPYFQEMMSNSTLELGNTDKIPLAVDFSDNALASCLMEIMSKRKTVRQYSGIGLTLTEISNLLTLTYSITGEHSHFIGTNGKKRHHKRRNIASGGGTFPVEVYYANIKTTEIPLGIYYYSPIAARIEMVTPFDTEDDIKKFYASLSVDIKADMDYHNAAGFIILAGYLNRTSFKYGDKAIKFAFIDTGALIQSMYLGCATLNIGCCAIGGYMDKQLDELLELKSNQHISILPIAIGKPVQQ